MRVNRATSRISFLVAALFAIAGCASQPSVDASTIDGSHIDTIDTSLADRIDSGDSSSSDAARLDAIDASSSLDATIDVAREDVWLAPDAGPVVVVALSGNGFVTQSAAGATEQINDMTDAGLTGWTSSASVISTYVYVATPGVLGIELSGTAPAAPGTTARVTVAGESFDVTLSASGTTDVGAVHVSTVGYLRIDVEGVSRPGANFGTLVSLSLRGPAAVGLVYANDPPNYYWSRRGASVHLHYTPADVEYFYGEVTVPVGEDAIGSYFMVNGFSDGYSGIQVISDTERWVIFSVWDPAAGMTTLVRAGTGVVAARFGGEGTGGQSHLVFPWVAGHTYAFLTRGRPDGAGATQYTTWFYAPESGHWALMAEWTRPATNTHLNGLYSFVEDFLSDNGYLERRALFGNEWARSPAGVWTEATSADYTVDATGMARWRLDFAGGLESGRFMLRNGGFFSDGVAAGPTFTRPAVGIAPTVNLATLP